jgi:hypothetical protein
MERQYYIVKIPNDNLIHALDVCIGDNATQRYSLDGKNVIVKTNQLLIDKKINTGIERTKIFPPGLTTELTYSQALSLMQTNEWQLNNI